MSTRYGSTGSRVRPSGGGFETLVWYLMRLTGVALFVLALAHFLILHVLYDPSQQDSTWIATVRWSSIFWRAFDWSLLMMVLLHAFLGVRTVVADYLTGGRRTAVLTVVYLMAFVLFAAGTMVVMTLPVVPKG
jgi:succinate dehydrogenase / fumarate reductase, membrane anchor subunit